MSKIRFIRTSQKANSIRKYDVFIDNQLETSLSNGEEKTIHVAPGRHTIYAKIDWCKSQKLHIDLKPEETVELICGSKLVGWRIWLALFYLFAKNKIVFLDYYTEGQKIDYGEKIPEDPSEKGILYFILKIGIIGWGLPVGFILFLVNLLIYARELTLNRIFRVFVINMSFFAIGGVFFGLFMWIFMKIMKRKQN